jgi:hypothetical protein
MEREKSHGLVVGTHTNCTLQCEKLLTKEETIHKNVTIYLKNMYMSQNNLKVNFKSEIDMNCKRKL